MDGRGEDTRFAEDQVNQPIPPETEELHAYVDGQLPVAEKLRVARRIENDASLRKRVESYQTLNAALKQLYDPVAQEPVPAALQRKRLCSPRYAGAIVAGIALLVFGVLVGTQLPSILPVPSLVEDPPIVDAAAVAYSVYSPEVRHPVEVPGEQEAHLVAWLTKRMGDSVSAPKLDEFGFLLVGGRLITSGTGPSSLLMYENREGKRVVLYITHHSHNKGNTAFRFAQKQEVSVFYWIDGPFAYALAGEVDRVGLLSLANAVYGQIAI